MKQGRARGIAGGLTAGLFVVLLLVPTAQAQDASTIGVTVTLDIPLDLATMEAVYERSGSGSNVQPCNADHFTVDPSGTAFTFEEEDTEQGCGEARFEVDIPEGAASLELVYAAERWLTQPPNSGLVPTEVQVVQEVRLYDPAEPDAPLQVRLEFPTDQADATTGSEPRPVPFVLPDGPAFIVGWYFEDQGAELEDGLPGTFVGQQLTATISGPSTRFHGVPAEGVEVETIHGAADRESAIVERHVKASVPAGLPSNALVSLTFQASDALHVDHVLGPEGDRVPSMDLVIQEDDGGLELILTSDVMSAHGFGTYTAVFVGEEPLAASEPLAFLVIVMMVFPIPTGIYATRGAHEFRKTAVGGYRTTALLLARSVYVWWFVYVALLALILIARLWPLIASWPMQLAAVLLLVGFAAVATAFLFTGFYWRRRLVHVMEEDLEEKRRTNVELERSNQELEQFAYVASHDLQEPLRTISRFTELIKHRYGEGMPKDANEFMDYTVDGARRMQALVDDLLEFSRVGTKGREFVDVDVADVVEQVTLGLDAAIKDNKATITHDDLPTVLGDRAQIAQVYQNLITNALKFRHGRRLPKIHLGAERAGKEWILSVKDNGIGIPDDQHERIFVIFQRLHGREEYEGTGIGLAVVKKIIERHGGRIWLESTPKQGTTFFFSLPVGSKVVEP